MIEKALQILPLSYKKKLPVCVKLKKFTQQQETLTKFWTDAILSVLAGGQRSTVYIVYCHTLYTLYNTVYSVQCKNVQCTVHSLQYTVYSVQCTVNSSVECPLQLYTASLPLPHIPGVSTRQAPGKVAATTSCTTVHCTLYSLHYTVQTVQFRL